jgi:isopenicillin N synthase-like dioxygenase
MHRVLNVSGDERYSIPFFFEPNYDTIVSPLHTCVTEERPAAFKPVVYGEHLTYKLDITYPHRQVPKDTTTPTAQ